jgi:hypothetical protein
MLIGANGSGKTRFMNRLIKESGSHAYVLSALSAFYPERTVSALPGSIDALYAAATAKSPYLKVDAVSECDKLLFMLINDESTYLITQKSRMLFEGGGMPELKPTKLDRIINLWQRIFPGNQILRHSNRLMFATESGGDAVSSVKLSQGEKAALYYIAATLYAMPDAVIFIDSPTLFLHPAILHTFWNSIEELRPDCRFVYNTYDVDFVSSRTEGVCVWVKSYDAEHETWDYQVLSPRNLSDDLFLELVGTRKPVLFVEGDSEHSIDSRLYTLIFHDYTVKALGSCDKVIETTRSFNDLKSMHHLDSHGIVDRDRRTSQEVAYLRRKNILVPEVAEVENLFLMESVIKTVAVMRKRDPKYVFKRVKRSIMGLWKQHVASQVLMHVRHRVKRIMEYRADGRFNSIDELERHIRSLSSLIKPRDMYREVSEEFNRMLTEGDYAGVLRVFNHKPMLSACGVAQLLGYKDRDAYIAGVLALLKRGGKDALTLSEAFRKAFKIEPGTTDPAGPRQTSSVNNKADITKVKNKQ